MHKAFEELISIAILIAVIGFVIARLPKVELGHSRGVPRAVGCCNWLPLGLTYAFLYMGRYNLTVTRTCSARCSTSPAAAHDEQRVRHDLRARAPRSTASRSCSTVRSPIASAASATILISARLGSIVANLAMGVRHRRPAGTADPMVAAVASSTRVNMYFQSFGAVVDRQGQRAVVPRARARHVRRHLRHPDLARPLLRLRRAAS